MSNILDREEMSEETGDNRVTHYKRNVPYLPKVIRDTTAMIGLSPKSAFLKAHCCVLLFDLLSFFGFGRTADRVWNLQKKNQGANPNS